MLLLHKPEQHSADPVQAAPLGKQLAAWTADGATTEVTKGTATAAATPNARIIWRRFIPANIAGGTGSR